jgi:PQQ-like domain
LPATSLWRVEEVLARLAGDAAPTDTAAGPAPASRQKAVRAWQKWWQERQGSVDLARAAESESYLGLVTVCEYDAAVPGRFQGQVWEASRNGPPRLKVTGLTGPMDAHVLRNGRLLVAENGASRVTERNRDGTIAWEYPVQGGNPICCERLANGNTFIATYNQLIEVRPDKTEVYRFQPGPQFYIFCARKTRAGTIVCITAQGILLEVDPVQAKTIRTINLGQPAGGWSGVEPLPNGHYLVATMNNSTVREVDEKGTTVWSVNTIPGVFRATRLPNGNTLVVSMNTREVAEIDRAGAVRWRKTCQGRPWSVHYR